MLKIDHGFEWSAFGLSKERSSSGNRASPPIGEDSRQTLGLQSRRRQEGYEASLAREDPKLRLCVLLALRYYALTETKLL
jgi:hypothetical protein